MIGLRSGGGDGRAVSLAPFRIGHIDGQRSPE